MSAADSDKIRLCHIRDAIDEILSYLTTVPVNDIDTNSMLRNAVIRHLEIIGEASASMSQTYKDAHSHIPWSSMSGLRNILNHKYFGVDVEIIKQVVSKDIPELRLMIIQCIDEYNL